MSSLKIRYTLYGLIASASLITLVAQANTTEGVFGEYFRSMITTACTGTGVVTGFDDIIGSAGYGTKICTGLSVPLAGYSIYPVGGNVGIGTSTPNAKLEVIGQVKITGGSPGLNKVLTSDENGLATWSGGSIVTPCVPGGTGWNNTCYGTGSLQYNTIGNYNTANGYQALYWNTTGGHNVANGYQALFSNDTGGQNVAIGYQALSYNNTAYNNTAIGNLALGSNSNGSNNTAIGNRSLNTNDSGEHNLANGFYSLYNNVVGSNNVGLGSFTLYISNGSNNTAIGYYAGSNLVTGANNIAIGSYTDFANVAGSNQLNIGNLIYGTGLVGGLAGNVGIGVTNLTAKLEVAGNIKIGNSGVTCSATTEGQIRYNTTTHIFEGCNGTTWKDLTSNNDINSCSATLPSCNESTCTLTYAPTSVNQPWTQNESSCVYTCTGGYSGVNCSVPPSCVNGAIDFPTCLTCGVGQLMQGGICVQDYHKVSFIKRAITCSEWATDLGWGPGPNPVGSCDGMLDNGRARTIEQGGGYAATYYGGYGGGSSGYGCAYGDVETWCYYSSPSTCGTEYSPGSVGDGLWNFYSNIYSSELTCSLPM